MEDILDPCQQRKSIYPIKHDDLWHHYKMQVQSFWNVDEIDFSKDRDEWNTILTETEQKFIKYILMFFATSDTIVSLNLMKNFCNEVSVIEAQVAYTYQAMMENIHAEVYSIMIDTYIRDDNEKEAILLDLGNSSAVKKKVGWIEKWSLNEDAPFALRLFAFIIVEGILFSGSFCAIYWIKHSGRLPGLTKSNEFIARDEGQHTLFGCCLYNKLKESRLSTEQAHEMIKDAIDIEKSFIGEALPDGLLGMNAGLMTVYVEYVADSILKLLNYDIIYGSENPFPWMLLLGMDSRSNFFEERVSTYQRSTNNQSNVVCTSGEDF